MTAEYNFTVPVEDLLEHAGGYDLPVDVDELVFRGQLKNGFFIEAGAAGGKLICDLHFIDFYAQEKTTPTVCILS